MIGLRTALAITLIQGILVNSIPYRDQQSQRYKSNEELEEHLLNLSAYYPDKVHAFSIGQTVEGRNLMAIAIAARAPEKHLPLRPNVLFTANIHGNEVVGRELLLRLAPYLVERYGQNDMITSLLENSRLIIIPSLNPDGFEKSKEGDCFSVQGRANRNGIDLNRNYPKIWKPFNSDQPEPETNAVIRWTSTLPIALSMDLHGGSLVVNYPFDSRNDSRDIYSVAPDDDVFRRLSLEYSKNSEKMASMGNTWCPLDHEIFKDGITNGADWYSVEGSLQDFMYVHRGSMAFTLEISCCKYPRADSLAGFWEDSVFPVLNFWSGIHSGIKGIVIEEDSREPLKAKLKIAGREVPFTASDSGDYYRILLPGKYRIIAEHPDYLPAIHDFELTEDFPKLTLNITMSKPKRAVL